MFLFGYLLLLWKGSFGPLNQDGFFYDFLVNVLYLFEIQVDVQLFFMQDGMWKLDSTHWLREESLDPIGYQW